MVWWIALWFVPFCIAFGPVAVLCDMGEALDRSRTRTDRANSAAGALAWVFWPIALLGIVLAAPFIITRGGRKG